MEFLIITHNCYWIFLDGVICSKIDCALIAVSTAILDVLPFRAVDCGTDLAWWWLKIMGDCVCVFGLRRGGG
jgi:hypothetical protein